MITYTGDDNSNAIDGSGGSDSISGLGGNDHLDGKGGNDLIHGDDGNDTLIGGAGNDTMYGDAGDDGVYGGDGDDLIIYDGGIDNIDGGDGVDTYDLIYQATETTNIAVNLTEAASSSGTTLFDGTTIFNAEILRTLVTGAGKDTLTFGLDQASFTWWAGDGLDRLIGDFSADSGGVYAHMGANGYVIDSYAGLFTSVSHNVEAMSLTGGVSADRLIGYFANDDLNGGGGDDILSGLAGNDRLDGGTGADTMAGGKGNDTYYVDDVDDQANEVAGQGTDLVYASVDFNLAGTEIENLTLIGSYDLWGFGNQLVNKLYGNSGDNVLDGKAGADLMVGDYGDDTYIVDDSGDIVRELGNRGDDTVFTSASFSVANSAVETIIMTGTGDLSVTGNRLSNTIYGNDGNNVLDGNGGTDVLFGGLGDDTYIVWATADQVIEDKAEGTDTVQAIHSFILPDHVENLTLIGTGSTAAMGNELDNIITGNTGSNRLTGGAGSDTFVFLLGSGADRVWDFSASEDDWIDISAYTHGVVNDPSVTITQSFGNTLIDLGGGNVITMARTHANDAGFLSHIIW